MFCIEQTKNGSTVHKYTLDRDQSCFLALLSLFLKSAILFFLSDCLTIAFAKLAKMAIFAAFQNLAIFRLLVVFLSHLFNRTS